VHPQELENFGIDYPVAAFEVSISVKPSKKPTRSRKKK